MLSVDVSLLEKHAASIFMVEMSRVRMWSGDIVRIHKRCTLKFMGGGGGDRTLVQAIRSDAEGTVKDWPFPGLLQRGKLNVSRWPSLRA